MLHQNQDENCSHELLFFQHIWHALQRENHSITGENWHPSFWLIRPPWYFVFRPWKDCKCEKQKLKQSACTCCTLFHTGDVGFDCKGQNFFPLYNQNLPSSHLGSAERGPFFSAAKSECKKMGFILFIVSLLLDHRRKSFTPSREARTREK